jgi:hypothetical protein
LTGSCRYLLRAIASNHDIKWLVRCVPELVYYITQYAAKGQAWTQLADADAEQAARAMQNKLARDQQRRPALQPGAEVTDEQRNKALASAGRGDAVLLQVLATEQLRTSMPLIMQYLMHGTCLVSAFPNTYTLYVPHFQAAYREEPLAHSIVPSDERPAFSVATPRYLDYVCRGSPLEDWPPYLLFMFYEKDKMPTGQTNWNELVDLPLGPGALAAVRAYFGRDLATPIKVPRRVKLDGKSGIDEHPESVTKCLKLRPRPALVLLAGQRPASLAILNDDDAAAAAAAERDAYHENGFVSSQDNVVVSQSGPHAGQDGEPVPAEDEAAARLADDAARGVDQLRDDTDAQRLEKRRA